VRHSLAFLVTFSAMEKVTDEHILNKTLYGPAAFLDLDHEIHKT